ncbi:soluble NSF attachment protein [Linnemannia elongata]|nr:soluble NSF attachment protein [Linnemannia elongata]
MLGFVFLILSCVVAVQTKPKQETFVPFLTTQRKNRVSSGSSSPATTSSSTSANNVSGWFTRNILQPLTGGPRIPEHTITDYYFFQMATLNDGSGSYIGLFGQWFVLSELQEVSEKDGPTIGGGSGGKAGSGNTYEGQAEEHKQNAIQAKGKRDYHGAARAYVEAAKSYEKSGSDFNTMEAAGAYEDAFKAYNMVQQTGPGIKCLENAARLFRKNERGGSRAAKIYTQLGDLMKTQDIKKAVEMYRESAELFKSEGDGRALQATIKLTELLCVLQQFQQAYNHYNDTIIPETMSQEILKFTTRDHIVNAILAHLGATNADWIMLASDLTRFEEMCPDFRGSAGCKALQALANAEWERDPQVFQEACQAMNRLRTGGMPDWQVGLLLAEKKKLEGGDLL